MRASHRFMIVGEPLRDIIRVYSLVLFYAPSLNNPSTYPLEQPARRLFGFQVLNHFCKCGFINCDLSGNEKPSLDHASAANSDND